MISVAKKMRALFVLILAFFLAAPALAAYESGTVGPYVASFNMNTTMKYTVYVEEASKGSTSVGIGFTRYNLTIDSDDYMASMVLTRYDEPMAANITANEYIIYNALMQAGADDPVLYQLMIDDHPGVLGNFRFEKQYLGQGQYKEGDLLVAAAYSPDARADSNGNYWGKTDCRVISTYPWEIIRDMIYTLHVEVPPEDLQSASINQSSPFDSIMNQSTLNQSTLNQSTLNQSTLNQSTLNQSTLNQSTLN